jgi:hypothetical protein
MDHRSIVGLSSAPREPRARHRLEDIQAAAPCALEQVEVRDLAASLRGVAASKGGSVPLPPPLLTAVTARRRERADPGCARSPESGAQSRSGDR